MNNANELEYIKLSNKIISYFNDSIIVQFRLIDDKTGFVNIAGTDLKFLIKTLISGEQLISFRDNGYMYENKFWGFNDFSFSFIRKDRDTFSLVITHNDNKNYILIIFKFIEGKKNSINIFGYYIEIILKGYKPNKSKYFISNEKQFKKIGNKMSNNFISFDYGLMDIFYDLLSDRSGFFLIRNKKIKFGLKRKFINFNTGINIFEISVNDECVIDLYSWEIPGYKFILKKLNEKNLKLTMYCPDGYKRKIFINFYNTDKERKVEIYGINHNIYLPYFGKLKFKIIDE